MTPLSLIDGPMTIDAPPCSSVRNPAARSSAVPIGRPRACSRRNSTSTPLRRNATTSSSPRRMSASKPAPSSGCGKSNSRPATMFGGIGVVVFTLPARHATGVPARWLQSRDVHAGAREQGRQSPGSPLKPVEWYLPPGTVVFAALRRCGASARRGCARLPAHVGNGRARHLGRAPQPVESVRD